MTAATPWPDRLLAALLWSAAVPVALLSLGIVVFLLIEAWPALASHGPGAFLGTAWQPEQGRVGLLAMASASLAVTGGALLLALPLGLACACWLHAYAPARPAAILRRLLELLAGLPSVVVGLWGLLTVVPLLGGLSADGSGQSLLAGALVLGLMILPLIALGADSAFAAGDGDLRRHANALGLSRWTTLCRVEWPAARRGITTATVLATGRALGETMVVVMLCGNVVQLPGGLLEPVRTLTANIALEMAYATAAHRSALIVGGLFLVALVALLVLAARSLARAEPHG